MSYGVGSEGTHIESGTAGVGHPVIHYDGRTKIEIVSGAGSAAIVPVDRRSSLVGIDRVQNPSTKDSVHQPGLQIQGSPLPDRQLIRNCRDKPVGMIERRDTFFGSGVRIVEPGHLLNQLREGVIEGERESTGKPLLKPDVQTMEVGTSGTEVLLDNAAVAVPSSGTIADRKLW